MKKLFKSVRVALHAWSRAAVLLGAWSRSKGKKGLGLALNKNYLALEELIRAREVSPVRRAARK